MLASQATAVAGWPSTAALTPVSVMSPLSHSTAGTIRESRASRGTGSPRTNAFDEALSAIVSTMPMRQSAMRLSMISTAGRNAAVAASTSSTVQSGPLNGAPRTNATSTSTRGRMHDPTPIVPPLGTSIVDSRWPKSGSSTPIIRCIAFDDSPTLCPTTTSPWASRRSMFTRWML